jgi:hypothetical protein
MTTRNEAALTVTELSQDRSGTQRVAACTSRAPTAVVRVGWKLGHQPSAPGNNVGDVFLIKPVPWDISIIGQGDGDKARRKRRKGLLRRTTPSQAVICEVDQVWARRHCRPDRQMKENECHTIHSFQVHTSSRCPSKAFRTAPRFLARRRISEIDVSAARKIVISDIAHTA